MPIVLMRYVVQDSPEPLSDDTFPQAKRESGEDPTSLGSLFEPLDPNPCNQKQDRHRREHGQRDCVDSVHTRLHLQKVEVQCACVGDTWQTLE